MVVAMDYLVEIWDAWGRRTAAFTDVPLMDVTRWGPDRQDTIRGLVPKEVGELGPGCEVRVYVDGALFCAAPVVETSPAWSDTRKLILDEYVPLHEVVEFEARSEMHRGNTVVSRAYTNREIGAIAKDAINSALGPIHYWVSHGAYPDGAEREYEKFVARKTDENELETGGIYAGQWAGGARLDLSEAYAKDGDTIAGVVVDGMAWPDIRLMLVDAEETSRNAHAVGRHPEVAFWTNEEYAASGYRRKADAAKAFLQGLLDTEGIDYIELNPHRNASGVFDDRVDAYGRYLGLVYGGNKCFNAAVVEQDLADVHLYDEGKYLVPEMALKDFFSYHGRHEDSVFSTEKTLFEFDVSGGVLEVLTVLCYAAGGRVFSVDPELGVHFREAALPDQVFFFDPTVMGVQLGTSAPGLVNYIYFEGNPLTGPLNAKYSRLESIGEYGLETRNFSYYSLSVESDAAKLAWGLLDDVAYPEPTGQVEFFHGRSGVCVGDLVEFRGEPLRRVERELGEEWGGRFSGKLMSRVKGVRHRFTGKCVSTRMFLTSPLRSVENPMNFIVRSQEPASSLFEFRLDDATVGLDMGFHLD